MYHNLKLNQRFADPKLYGLKRFEIRFCGDRNFNEGDTVKYSVVDDLGEPLSHPINDKLFKITYITDYKQRDNYIVFGDAEIEGGAL